MYVCICVRVMNFVRKKESACREVRECVSRSERASVEKSRRKREQSESYEKENRVRVTRKRTECIESCEN